MHRVPIENWLVPEEGLAFARNNHLADFSSFLGRFSPCADLYTEELFARVS